MNEENKELENELETDNEYDSEVGRLFVFRHMTDISVEIDPIIDRKIDCYSLGVFVKLLYLTEMGQPWEEIYKISGKAESVNLAIKKLQDNGYISFSEES